MYTANVQAKLEKTGGIIIPFVSRSPYSGEKAQVVNFLGPVEFTERNTPYADTKLSEVEHTQRWIVGREFDCAILIDRLDTLKMIYEPTSPYVERMREAAARKMDAIVMEKFYAVAKTGKDGTTDTIYKAANTVAHGTTRMSVAKLRALRKLMKKRHVNLRTQQPFLAVTAEQADDLLGETQVGSSDYNAIKALVDGEVSKFMGFMFVPYEDYGDALNGNGIPSYVDGADTIRQCPAWVSDGMHFGDWQ
ncbi:MAG: phage capsid protein, partial [Tepidimonas sp.]